MTEPGARGITKLVRSIVLSSGERAWTVADFPDHPAPAVAAAFARLKRDGELVAVRRGLYWRGDHRPWGMTRPDPLAATGLIAGPDGLGYAGLSASNVFGLTTQVPAVDTIAVVGRAPGPMPGVRYVSRSNTARYGLTVSEVSVLEVLRAWGEVVDLRQGEAVACLAAELRHHRIDPTRLVAAAAGEPAIVRTRLVDVLAQGGHAR